MLMPRVLRLESPVQCHCRLADIGTYCKWQTKSAIVGTDTASLQGLTTSRIFEQSELHKLTAIPASSIPQRKPCETSHLYKVKEPTEFYMVRQMSVTRFRYLGAAFRTHLVCEASLDLKDSQAFSCPDLRTCTCRMCTSKKHGIDVDKRMQGRQGELSGLRILDRQPKEVS